MPFLSLPFLFFPFVSCHRLAVSAVHVVWSGLVWSHTAVDKHDTGVTVRTVGVWLADVGVATVVAFGGPHGESTSSDSR